MVDVGLGHLPQELPGKRGQAFDVPPLALGKQGVEGERAFAAAGDARQANQLVAGQGDVDGAQVVLACAFDNDVGSGHTSVQVWGGRRAGGGVVSDRSF
jgi:hypothetical protein